MNLLDDRILEHLNENSWSSPGVIASKPDFRVSESRIKERCEMLVWSGLVAPIHQDIYEITIWGMRYLEGEIDAAHQPRPSPQVVHI